jgi:hypothetical protein
MFWLSIYCTILVNLGLLVKVIIEMRRAVARGKSRMQSSESTSTVEEMPRHSAPPRVEVAEEYQDIAV